MRCEKCKKKRAHYFDTTTKPPRWLCEDCAEKYPKIPISTPSIAKKTSSLDTCSDFCNLFRQLRIKKDCADELPKISQSIQKLYTQMGKGNWLPCKQTGEGLYYVHDTEINMTRFFDLLSTDDTTGILTDHKNLPSRIRMCTTCIYNLMQIAQHLSGFMIINPIQEKNITNKLAGEKAKAELPDGLTIYNPNVWQIKLKSEVILRDIGIKPEMTYQVEQRAAKIYKSYREATKQTMKDLPLKKARYLFITPPIGPKLLASGFDVPEHSAKWRIAMNGDPKKCKECFTFKSQINHCLQYIIVTGGHGGAGYLFEKTEGGRLNREFHQKNVVEPLKKAGITCEVLVLDECLTASMIDVYLPLLGEDGVMISNMYSTPLRIINKDTFETLTAGTRTPKQRMGEVLSSFVQAFGKTEAYITCLCRDRTLYYDMRMGQPSQLAKVKTATAVEKDNKEIEECMELVQKSGCELKPQQPEWFKKKAFQKLFMF